MCFGRAHSKHVSDSEAVNLILKASEHKQNAFPWDLSHKEGTEQRVDTGVEVLLIPSTHQLCPGHSLCFPAPCFFLPPLSPSCGRSRAALLSVCPELRSQRWILTITVIQYNNSRMLMKDTIKGTQAFTPGNTLINPITQCGWVEDHPDRIPKSSSAAAEAQEWWGGLILPYHSQAQQTNTNYQYLIH